MWWRGMDSYGSQQDSAVISCEHENENFISIRGGKYLAQMSEVHGMICLETAFSRRRCEQVKPTEARQQ